MKTIIVGAGMGGLAVASLLAQAGQPWHMSCLWLTPIVRKQQFAVGSGEYDLWSKPIKLNRNSWPSS